MIHYTEALTGLIADIVDRVDGLSFIDVKRLLVFARYGRTRAAGAYATCHCLNLPDSDPGYYFWRDRQSGLITRRTECFVVKTPEVWLRQTRLDYLISFSLPRFCDQVIDGARKAKFYGSCEPWVAKLDTVVHELYHIAPQHVGLRKFESCDGQAPRSHGPLFLEEVAWFVRAYLASRPDPRHYDFLRHNFHSLARHDGGVLATTFVNFPSYPQRYPHPVAQQPDAGDVTVLPIKVSTQPRRYTERDLQVRAFTVNGSRRLRRRELDSVA